MGKTRIFYRRLKQVLYNKFKDEPWFSEVLSYMIVRYHSIENRMIETFRYVDCNPENFGVFSYEYASILRDSGSVFGSIMDRLVRETSPQPAKNEYDMRDYRKWLVEKVEKIRLVTVRLIYPIQKRFLDPFKRIERLEWWIAYNNVKHSDIRQFKDGNLGNALNALGALAILYVALDSNNGSQIRLFDEIGYVSWGKSLLEVYK